CVLGDDELMADTVKFGCRNARLDVLFHQIHRLGCKTSRSSDLLDACSIVNITVEAFNRVLFAYVVRPINMRRDWQLGSNIAWGEPSLGSLGPDFGSWR